MSRSLTVAALFSFGGSPCVDRCSISLADGRGAVGVIAAKASLNLNGGIAQNRATQETKGVVCGNFPPVMDGRTERLLSRHVTDAGG